MTHQLDDTGGRDILARWCALAERRLDYLTELFETGRWRRFHSEPAFLENIREAKAALEAWRDLLSREASRDNRAIDVSWLGRPKAALPRGEIWRDRVRLPRSVDISVREPLENSLVPEAKPVGVEEAFSGPAIDEGTTELMQRLAAIVERYPLLRNTL